MMASQQPYRESIWITVRRTFAIAVIVGGVIALASGRPRAWLLVAGLVLWPSFGGHWVEVFFLNWLRPRLPREHALQSVVRLAVWFVAGCALGVCVLFTMRLSSFPPITRTPPWWAAGVAFIGVELVAHFALSMRNRPSFFRGDG
jgi:hypothetical protein